MTEMQNLVDRLQDGPALRVCDRVNNEGTIHCGYGKCLTPSQGHTDRIKSRIDVLADDFAFKFSNWLSGLPGDAERFLEESMTMASDRWKGSELHPTSS